MKKITFLLTISAFMAINSAASAVDKYHYTPYIGANYIYSDAKAKGFSPNYHNGGVIIGSDYSPYFGTELFFNQSGSDSNRAAIGKIKTSYRAYGLDMLAYLPLGCAKKFSLAATAGIGEYVFKHKLSGQKHHNEHGYGYRFGGGVRWAFTSHWQTKLLARYVKFDAVDGFNHAVEYSLGVEYHF